MYMVLGESHERRNKPNCGLKLKLPPSFYKGNETNMSCNSIDQARQATEHAMQLALPPVQVHHYIGTLKS